MFLLGVRGGAVGGSGKELIGGLCVIDVADLDEALDMARTWPGQSSAVEIRPVVE